MEFLKRIYPNYEVVIPRLAGINCNKNGKKVFAKISVYASKRRNPALAGINCNYNDGNRLQMASQHRRNPALAGINCNRLENGYVPLLRIWVAIPL